MPSMTITQVVQSSGNVEKLLANLGRKRHPILGDGNCFFRALSFIVNDTEDFHSTVRANIVLFAELNSSFFSKYCTSSRIDTHIQSMKWERVHATQMEAHVAASCCSEHCTFSLKRVEVVSIIGSNLIPSHSRY